MKKWWIIPVVILLTAAVLIFTCWEGIVTRFAPKIVLSDALSNTLTALGDRMKNSPLTILEGMLDPEFRYTIDMQLDAENELLGPVHYDMDVQYQGSPQQIMAQGTASASDYDLDLSLYMDGNFAAIASQDLLKGNFYGITYETFGADMRSNFLFSMLAGSSIEEWEASVLLLQNQMRRTYQIPDFTYEDIQMILTGIIGLKSQVTQEMLVLNGQQTQVYKITFTATGQEIGAAAGPYLSQISEELRSLVTRLVQDTSSNLRSSFYVYEDLVVKLTAELTMQDGGFLLEADLGTDPYRNDLSFAVEYGPEALKDKLSVTVSTADNGEVYSEKLDVVTVKESQRSRTALDYDWNPATGDLQLDLTAGSLETAVLLNLQNVDGGFQVTTDQFEALLAVLTGRTEAPEKSSFCTMRVQKGSFVETPNYKNFDQWSMEDILILIEGVGGLFGISIR